MNHLFSSCPVIGRAEGRRSTPRALRLRLSTKQAAMVAALSSSVNRAKYSRNHMQAVAMKQFGGFTGDLAGWFLQICELAMLAAATLAERVIAIWF